MANLKGIVTLIIVGVMIFLCVKMGPPYFYNYELQQDIESIARLATYAGQKSGEDVRDDIINKAKEDNVTLTAENITVEKTQSSVNIDVQYSVPISVGSKTFEMKFHPTAGNKMLTAK